MDYKDVRPLIGIELTLMGMPHSGTPCPMCLNLAPRTIWWSMVMPLPNGALAPLSRYEGGPICHDCASAETLIGLDILGHFDMARIAVGNDRLEQLRLPGVPMGLVADGIVRPSHPGDMMTLLTWQRHMGYPDQPQED